MRGRTPPTLGLRHGFRTFARPLKPLRGCRTACKESSMSTASSPSAASAAAFARGLEGVIAGQTSICSVEQGALIYRGYEIHDLADNATFEDVAFLLLEVHKPAAAELTRFNDEIKKDRTLPQPVIDFLKSSGPWLNAGT